MLQYCRLYIFCYFVYPTKAIYQPVCASICVTSVQTTDLSLSHSPLSDTYEYDTTPWH